MSQVERAQNYELRRKISSRIVKTLWPYKEIPHNNALERIRELADQDCAFVFAHAHIAMIDPFLAAAFAARVHKKILRREMTSPIADHQRYFGKLATWNGANTYPIVTRHTVEKGKNIRKPSLRNRLSTFIDARVVPLITWEGYDEEKEKAYEEARKIKTLSRGHGEREYAKGSGQTLARKGTVFVAPHGGRTSEPAGPAGRAIELITKFAQKPLGDGDKATKIAIVLVGTNIRGVEQYAKGKTDGLNLFKKFVLEIEVFTLDELKELATTNGVTLDEEITNRINNLSYKTYLKPKQLRKIQSETPSPRQHL